MAAAYARPRRHPVEQPLGTRGACRARGRRSASASTAKRASRSGRAFRGRAARRDRLHRGASSGRAGRGRAVAASAGTRLRERHGEEERRGRDQRQLERERQAPEHDRARARPREQAAPRKRTARSAPQSGETGEPAEVLGRRARAAARASSSRPLSSISRSVRGDDLRGDQEHGARAQQRRHASPACSSRLSVSATCERKAARPSASDDGWRAASHGSAAAARFEQHEAGESGGGHAFVCRLVARTLMQPARPRPVAAASPARDCQCDLDLQPALLAPGGRRDARAAARRGVPRRRRPVGARRCCSRTSGCCSCGSRSCAPSSASRRRRALILALVAVDGHASPRLVAARLLGGGARRPGRRQGLPAARALAAALLPRWCSRTCWRCWRS